MESRFYLDYLQNREDKEPSCEDGSYYSKGLEKPPCSTNETSSSAALQSNCNNNSNTESRELSPQENPRRKRVRVATSLGQKGCIEATLEGKALWEEFCRRGTEMIVNRAGRRMFPGFSVAISALKPKAKYSMKLEVVLADNHRFKFLNSRWLAVGSAEPQPLSESYLHPDSPNSGAFWMRHGVSFRKLKITNNKERPGNNALLYSMHKYFLRLIVEEERKSLSGEGKPPPKIVLRADFPETTFIAVTAYQNEEVTQLKITNNPFAKAFRENTADMDWETAQIFYSNQAAFSPQQHPSEHSTGGYWPFTNPLVPVTPLAGLPPFVPPPALPLPNSASSTGYHLYGHSAFQWPPLQHTTSESEDHNLSASAHMTSSSTSIGLPDFDTVFTTLSD